jgi:hypothetical protein
VTFISYSSTNVTVPCVVRFNSFGDVGASTFWAYFSFFVSSTTPWSRCVIWRLMTVPHSHYIMNRVPRGEGSCLVNILTPPPPKVLAYLITNHFLSALFSIMVIITLQQIIDERISFLKEQINPNNKPELNSTFQIQIDAIRSAAQDLEKVEPLIMQKKELLKNSTDIQETDRLLAELEALEWLQAQIVVFTLGNREPIGH